MLIALFVWCWLWVGCVLCVCVRRRGPSCSFVHCTHTLHGCPRMKKTDLEAVGEGRQEEEEEELVEAQEEVEVENLLSCGGCVMSIHEIR